MPKSTWTILRTGRAGMTLLTPSTSQTCEDLENFEDFVSVRHSERRPLAATTAKSGTTIRLAEFQTTLRMQLSPPFSPGRSLTFISISAYYLIT